MLQDSSLNGFSLIEMRCDLMKNTNIFNENLRMFFQNFWN